MFCKIQLNKLLTGIAVCGLFLNYTASSEEFIKLIKKDNSEIMIDISKLRVIKVTDITSVEKNENINFSDIKIYPNPTNDKINIDLSKINNINFNDISIKMYDSSQKLIKKIDKMQSNNIEVDLMSLNLSSGAYFIEIAEGKNIFNLSKLIIE